MKNDNLCLPLDPLSEGAEGLEGTCGTAIKTSEVKIFNGLTDEFVPVAAQTDAPTQVGFFVLNEQVGSGNQKFSPGVWFRKSLDKAPEYICAPLHVVAVTHNHDEGFGFLLRFRNRLGSWQEWIMPMHLLKGTGEELRGVLLDKGMTIAPTKSKLLNYYLHSKQTRKQILAVDRAGWCRDDLFVMTNKCIGKQVALYQGEAVSPDDFETSGTLAGWQFAIGRQCQGNPLLTLAIGIALAGPLLGPLKKNGGGFHYIGNSSTGKTTALQAACSVWGSGQRFKRSWRATGNGLEGIAAQRNDTLLVLDEMGEAIESEIGSLIYALANGVGKARALRTGAARRPRRWNVMLISSGELRFSKMLEACGKKSRTGQEVRLIDISVDRKYGAWDNLHGMVDGRSFSDSIQRASTVDYGHLGPEFLRALIASDELDSLAGKLATILNAFSFTGGQEGRVAERFAIVALAIELAVSHHLLSLDEGDGIKSMIELFEEWKIDRGSEQSEDSKILHSIKEFVSRYGQSRFSELNCINPDKIQSISLDQVRDRAGWWESEGCDRNWLFTGSGITQAVPGYDTRRVMDALDAAGCLVKRDKDKRSKQMRIQGSKYNIYCVRLPEI